MMLDRKLAWRHVRQSKMIEGIMTSPTEAEMEEFLRFVHLDQVTIPELERFVNVFQPGAVLRSRPGLNVYIGDHRPIFGGPMVVEELRMLLTEIHEGRLDPFHAHGEYEGLHPFTDCNGRSGRALWTWQMIQRGEERWLRLPVRFLHRFYYDALANFHRLAAN